MGLGTVAWGSSAKSKMVGTRSLCWLKPATRLPAGVADDERHHQRWLIQAVVVKPALVIAKGLAMIAVEYNRSRLQYRGLPPRRKAIV